MDKEQRIAFINSQIVCAMAEIEGMKAENHGRVHRGEAIAYVDEDFFGIVDKFGLSHNRVIMYLSDFKKDD